MRAIVAGVAIAALLGSGCSWLVDRPSTASRVADVGIAVTAALALPLVRCQASGGDGDGCFGPHVMLYALGPPALLVTAISGSFALSWDAERRDAPALEEGVDPEVNAPLPEIPTDPGTLQLARQARAAAVSGQCVAARAAMGEIAARDADYHIAMLVKGVLGACR